jgi:hypothetical protein
MTESKGTLKIDFSEIDNYLKRNFNNIVNNGNNVCNQNNINNQAPTPEYECAPHIASEANFSPIKENYLNVEKFLESDVKSDAKNFENNKIKEKTNSDKLKDDTSLKSLRYPISTYKGQSGSPIFLRIKKNDNNPKNKYIYVFIGLHSRRGPIISEKLNEITSSNQNIENNINNEIKNTENFCISETENSSDSFPIQNKYLQLNKNLIKPDYMNKIGGKFKAEESEYKNLIMKNGICNYNVALNILGDTSKNIMDVIINNKDIPTRDKPIMNSEFVLVKLFDKENMALKGLFKNQLNMEVLFQVASDYKKLPIEFIRFKQCSDQFSKNYLTFNHDREKFLNKMIENEEENSELEFSININKNTYSKFIAENIYNKFSENFNMDKVKLDFKKYSKHLFDTIFTELKGYNPNTSFYGKFFKLIRDYLLKKIGVENYSQI